MSRYVTIICISVMAYLIAACKTKGNFNENDLAIVTDSISYIDSGIYQDQDSLTKAIALKCGILLNPQGNYTLIKSGIIAKRNTFQVQYSGENNEPIMKIGDYVTKTIVNELIPHWYGTHWDFNGYTSRPGQGDIACSYFIFTVLRDAGFNINRYRFSQAHGLNSVKAFCKGDSILILNSDYVTEMSDSIQSLIKDGLYLVALSNHVGFLYKKAGNLFFIHSNYLYPHEVMIELASKSEAFRSTSIYVIGSVTNNKSLMMKWINGTELLVQ